MKSLKLVVILFTFIFCFQCSGQDSKLNQALIARIDSLIQKDLSSLSKARELRKQFGMQSLESKLEDLIGDSIRASNIMELDKILEKHGWPEEDEIGEDGAYSFFSIIQHSGVNKRPDYLPIIRQAVRNGKCRPRYLAGVEDEKIEKCRNEKYYYLLWQ